MMRIGARLVAASGGIMALRLRLLLLLALWTLAAPGKPGSEEAGDGGWRRGGPGAPAAVTEEERCTVERRADLTYGEFVQHYAFSRPVILLGLTDNSKFRVLCSRERLLAAFGDSMVRLSTANTYSYQKVDLPFQEYVEQLLRPQDPTSLGNGEPVLWGRGGEVGYLRGPRCQDPAPCVFLAGRHLVFLWGQQLHRMGTPFPPLHRTPVWPAGHHSCLQLWNRRSWLWGAFPLAWARVLRGDLRPQGQHGMGADAGRSLITTKSDFATLDSSAGSCIPLRRLPSSTQTRPRWPGSGTHTQPWRPWHGPWSALSGQGRCCISLTAGGTPPSTSTPASSFLLSSDSSCEAIVAGERLHGAHRLYYRAAAVEASAHPTLACSFGPRGKVGEAGPQLSANSPEPKSRTGGSWGEGGGGSRDPNYVQRVCGLRPS